MIESVRPIVGKVDLYPQMKGEGIVARDVVVWTPPKYDAAGERHYPVLYMQDGQNLFRTELKRKEVDWHVDETCDELTRQGEIDPPIVVGIFCTKLRTIEYAPGRIGDAYRRFVVERLKPFIDERYRTIPDRAHTFAGGSSMGGLVSFMFVWEYKEALHGSTHTPPGAPAQAHVYRLYTDLTGTPRPAYPPTRRGALLLGQRGQALL